MKMTKFEEKLEILPIKTIQHPVGDTKYYAAVHVKTLIAQADEEIANLKSQLQQQALPVVPDFIGKLINTFGAPEDGKYINYSASYLEIQKELDWIDNHQKTWLTALLIGFRVEKPQLFYLRDELTGQFLAKDNQFKNEDRYFFWTGADPLTHSIGTAWKLTFTQQEIDSMQTGSYELVPVEDGE
ncbi:DUF1642 domain-containing protein [Lactococcus lactis subsp. lactis]|uniref:Prophage pi1 protein 19 n=13 Tax=Lactococcus lactis TaxID=1358 RepID=Q9CB08_LACLA|nr:DUF1642 domain-containing protein [Lactococcus phage bIL285]NP_076718.1 DUF1642 domain-containing protein [Lactococcus phage bIL309]AAK04552.1 prophage pi1 protein 19 [Lactococcus lactis subsp. lactis Il1403]AYV52210.1 DUF1642 domain-containing protein [Lactococcus lactis]EQC88097.1 hypothetical protein LLDT4_06745 [Lactococcus lactis subsp. lactis bv. diacetylactis str. TIFN4]EQC93432.1 hypothetical protein LLDT2_07220 [Lactococcus lactis subsp. lactis bv. diacetylactis str. TIFN2]ESK7820